MLFSWVARSAPGLSIVFLVILAYYVITREAAASGFTLTRNNEADSLSRPARITFTTPTTYEGAGFWTLIFAYYCLTIHILVSSFPLRSMWSIFDISRCLERTARSKSLRDYKISHRRRGSFTSLSSSETLTSSKELPSPSSTASSEAGDTETEFVPESETGVDRVIHAIIIPNYKEEMDTLRETLDVIASHPLARDTYDVYLAMEAREPNVEAKALAIINEFVKKFRSIDFTLHPPDIPGEAPGKGSNMAWAGRKLSEKYPLSVRKDVIITGIDADSHLSSNYFALLTSMHNAHPETATTTLYAAPIIFDRNAHEVPAIVRVADILWGAAGMSGLYRGSSIAPPTSVYSLPLQLVDRVGGWDCDSEAIGEDLHMYLKCFFALNGNLTVRTIHSPVSQSNVKGDGGEGVKRVYNDMDARYKQALRHMWGALDVGYAIRKFVELWQERKHTTRAFRPLHLALKHPNDSYIKNHFDADPEQPLESGIYSEVTTETIKEPDWQRTFLLAHRLFEAHFLPLHTTIMIVTSTLYMTVTEGGPDPHNVGWIFAICKVLRTVGLLECAFLLFLYERFHKIGATTREKEMQEAGLAKGMCFSHRSAKSNFVDYLVFPLVGALYGSIPSAQAQLMHFFTNDLVYTVSKKVTRQRAKSFIAEVLS
ncbi:glycosyl transferase family group 2-domain-containing protein [Xylaria bambusicola]|uniref:glycosyl transferase family group 2-domain-containing protein n=1 Tax=Xylaria bambusicola TaxID=326684 RepID=UPI002008E8CA|nr:glycosyl transferase family group 2-domain-containing protein [Xylaria bambusicola]KAI0512458.1 glycosyl transferase family group 2-domain-containing protein [Xylaria bambusicola]